MQFDMERLSSLVRYELLLGTVVPRPIALITTLDSNGIPNAAPYSLFNVMSHDPPIVAVSILPHPEHRLKDTGQNIIERKEFVVNLVSEGIAEAMNVACIDAPTGINEIDLAGLEVCPSATIAPPRLAASPVALECRFLTSLSFGPNQAILIGRVAHVHVADEYVLNAEQCVIDTPKLKLIGGMHGAKWYSRTSDLFAMERPTWAGWVRDGKVSEPST